MFVCTVRETGSTLENKIYSSPGFNSVFGTEYHLAFVERKKGKERGYKERKEKRKPPGKNLEF